MPACVFLAWVAHAFESPASLAARAALRRVLAITNFRFDAAQCQSFKWKFIVVEHRDQHAERVRYQSGGKLEARATLPGTM